MSSFSAKNWSREVHNNLCNFRSTLNLSLPSNAMTWNALGCNVRCNVIIHSYVLYTIRLSSNVQLTTTIDWRPKIIPCLIRTKYGGGLDGGR